MVRFAKTLLKSKYAPWSEYYLDYKRLKKLLKKAGGLDHSLQRERREGQRRFRQLLEEEIEKVTLFFLRKQGDLAERLSSLGEERRRLGAGEDGNQEEPARPPARPAAALGSVLTEIDRLKAEYRSQGEQVCHLVHFIYLNVTAVRKILKKHDKNFAELSLLRSFWAVEVTRTDFSHLPQMYHYEGIAAIVASIKKALSELKGAEYEVQVLLGNPELSQSDLTLTFSSLAASPPDLKNFQYDPILIRIDAARRNLNQSTEFVKAMAASSGLFFETDSDSFVSKEMPEEIDHVSSFLNLASTFLYMANYYIVAPTGGQYVDKLGGDPALVGLVIGMTPVATLFSTILYSWWANHSYKNALLFASFCSLLGNVFYSLALPYASFNMVLVGRVLNGFGGARAVNRRYIADTYSREDRTAASAMFVTAGALGMSAGPAAAALFGFINNEGTTWTPETAPGWVMGAAWTVYIAVAYFYFQEPKRESANTDWDQNGAHKDDFDEDGNTLSAHLSLRNSGEHLSVRNGEHLSLLPNAPRSTKTPSLFSNVPVVTTLALYFVLKLVLECLFSSCPTLTHFYFHWSSAFSGSYLAFLGILIFPANLCLAKLSYRYDDREIIFVVTAAMLAGLVGIVSYGGASAYSAAQYVLFGVCIFVSTNVLEGASMSLLSKTIPSSYAKGVFNSGFLATEWGTLGRAVGDIFISYVGVVGFQHLLNVTFGTLIAVVALTTLGVYKVYPHLVEEKETKEEDDDSETYNTIS